MRKNQLTFGSLFAGIGGFDLGFERAGMVCEWQVEIDGYCQQVLQKHWPDVRRWDDVRTWPQPDTEPVDIICGGFPCQDISYTGRGAGINGERSGLFFEAIRVVYELRPKYIVLENVAALLTRGLDRVLGTLAEIGYDAEWHCIPAAVIGAPHIRDRAFILAYTDINGQLLRLDARDMERLCPIRQWRQKKHGFASVFDSLRAGRSVDFSGVPRMDDGVSNRVDRLGGLGNAVVPQIAEWIGRRIVDIECSSGN